MSYNIKKHGDFKEYFDNGVKRHIWTLGYFGGGPSIMIHDAYNLAKQYADTYQVPVDTIFIAEILQSRRFRGFKYIYSIEEQTPSATADCMDNVFDWLTD